MRLGGTWLSYLSRRSELRLEELRLEHFGPFSGDRVGVLSPGLNVIHGPNEAGKSALRAFIRAVLFGFLPRNSRDFSFYHYPAVDGSPAGGTITVVTDNGGRYTVRRREGRSGGPVEVWGDRQGGEELLRELLGGVGPELYQNLFSISLSELQDFASLNQAGVRDRIYSAGLGLSGMTLPDSLKQLEAERSGGSSSLWAPRSGKLRDLFHALSAKQRELEEARGHQERYADLGRQLRQLQEQAENVRATLTHLRTEEALASKLLELRAHWLRSQELGRRIERLPDPATFPVDGVAALERLQNEVVHLRDQIREGDLGSETRKREMAQLVIMPAFSERQYDIEQLLETVQQYQQAVNDLPDVEREATEQANLLQAELSALGPGWDEDRIDQPFDFEARRAEFREAGAVLNGAIAEKDKAENRAHIQAQRREEAAELTGSIQTRLDGLEAVPPSTAEELEARATQLEVFRRALAKKRETERELRDQETRLADVRSRTVGQDRAWMRPVAAVLAVGGVAFVAAGFATHESLAGVAGVVAFAGAVILEILRRGAQAPEPIAVEDADPVTVMEQHVAALRSDAANATSNLDRLKAELTGPAPNAEDEVLEQLDRVRRETQKRREYDQLIQQLTEAQTALKDTVEAEQQSALEFGNAGTAVTAAEDRWRRLLEGSRLDLRLGPADALAALEQVRAARERQVVVKSLRDRISRMTATISDIERRLLEISEAAGLPRFEPGAATAALRRVQEAYDAHKGALRDRHALEKQNEAWTEKRRGLEVRLAETRSKIQELLQSAGVQAEEAFRQQANWVADRRALETELDELRRNHPELFGEDRTRYLEPLETSSEEHLITGRAELRLEIDAAEEEQARLQTEIGSLSQERRLIEDDNPVSALQTEIGELREQANELSERWAVLTLAKHFIEQTRDEFQKDRQAPLLKTAGDHFRAFTLGRYTSVTNPIGEERIVVSDTESGGELKDPAALSRGTAEQLFLAMRFAWIDEYARERESLPVLMDDVLVNFDPERARAVCERVVNLSQRHQVLVLTCHPETVARVRQAATDAGADSPKVIDLAGGA